jgi:hypothetical protein
MDLGSAQGQPARSARRIRHASISAFCDAGSVGVALPAAAQDRGMPFSTCGEQAYVTGYLRDQFQEVPVSLGLQADGRMLQVFASEDTGSWTMVSTTANGTSCIVAVGEAWQVLPTGRWPRFSATPSPTRAADLRGTADWRSAAAEGWPEHSEARHRRVGRRRVDLATSSAQEPRRLIRRHGTSLDRPVRRE